MNIIGNLFKKKEIQQEYAPQEYAKESQYRELGITCKIIECESPCFIYNIDERNIIQYPDTFHVNNGILQIKPGNRMVNVKTYSELSEDIIKEINSSNGIAIMPRTSYDVKNPIKLKHYRFAILPME